MSEPAETVDPIHSLPKRKLKWLAWMMGTAILLSGAMLVYWLINEQFGPKPQPQSDLVLQRLGTLDYYCTSEPTEIHYSPDGKFIVTHSSHMLGGNRDCRVFTMQSGKAIFCPRIRAANWESVAWRSKSPGGDNPPSLMGVSRKDATFRVSQINLLSNTIDWQTKPFPGELIRFPLKTAGTDGPILVTTKDAMHLFEDYKLISRIPFSAIKAASISSDGRYLACAHADGVCLWDIEKEGAVSQTMLSGEVMDLVFFSDSSQLAITVSVGASAVNNAGNENNSGEDNSVEDNTADSDAQPYEQAKHRGELRLWDLTDGSETTLLTTLSGIPFGLRINRHDSRILVDSLGTEKLFDVKTGGVIKIATSNWGRGKGFSSAFDPAKEQIAISSSRLSYYSARDGSRLSDLPQHTYQLAQVEALDDGHVISREYGGPTLLWEIASGRPTMLFEASQTDFHLTDQAALSFESTGTTEESLILSEVAFADMQRNDFGTFDVTRFYDLDNENLLIAGAGGDISVMSKSGDSIGTPVRLTDITQQPFALQAIFLPGTDLMAIEVFEGLIFIADYLTGQVVTQFAGGAFWGKMGYAPKRRELIYWQGNSLWSYRLPDSHDFSDKSLHRQLSVVNASPDSDGQEPLPFGFGSNGFGSNVAVSPDEQLIAVSGSLVKQGPRLVPRIRILALTDGKELASCYGKHRARVACLCFTPDGKRLVSASDDTTLIVWDVQKACQSSQSSQD